MSDPDKQPGCGELLLQWAIGIGTVVVMWYFVAAGR